MKSGYEPIMFASVALLVLVALVVPQGSYPNMPWWRTYAIVVVGIGAILGMWRLAAWATRRTNR